MTITDIINYLETRITNYKGIEEIAIGKREYIIAENARTKYVELIFIRNQIIYMESICEDKENHTA